MFLLLLTVGWMSHDPAWTTSRMEGLGQLRVIGLTEGTRHPVPGMPGFLDNLPEDWRDTMARRLGYHDVSWKITGTQEEVLVWCEWRLEKSLPPGGWFEPVLVDPSGQIIALGNYPKVAAVPGRHVEPIRFPITHVLPGSVLQVRRFQPGSPFRDVVAQIRLPEF